MKTDLNKMKEKLENIDNKPGMKKKMESKFFKPEHGEQDIRFLPSHDGDPHKEFHMHYNVGTSFLCPKRNFGERCAVCDYAFSLWREGTDESQKMAKDLFASQRFYSNILVRGKEAEGVKPYGYSKNIYKKLLKLSVNPAFGDIVDLDEGYDFELSYEKGAIPKQSKSDITIKPIKCPIAKTKKEIKEIVDKIQPLENFFDRKTPEEVKLILEQFLEDPFSGGSQQTKYGAPPASSQKETEVRDFDEALNELTSSDDDDLPF